MSVGGNVIYRGAEAPESVTVTVAASGAEDLTTVSAASIWVKRGTQAPVQWSASIVSQTTTSITLQHVFQSGDVAVAGRLAVVAHLTTPSGVIRSKPTTLIVVDPFTLGT